MINYRFVVRFVKLLHGKNFNFCRATNAGKTTLCENLKEDFPGAHVINMDNYFVVSIWSVTFKLSRCVMQNISKEQEIINTITQFTMITCKIRDALGM